MVTGGGLGMSKFRRNVLNVNQGIGIRGQQNEEGIRIDDVAVSAVFRKG